MFYRFNAHRQTGKASNETGDKKPGRPVASPTDKMYRKFATFLARQADRLRPGYLKLLMLLAAAAAGSFFGFLIIGQTQDSLPAFLRLKDQEQTGESISRRILDRQAVFQTYLDSLENEVIKDSIDHFQNLKNN